MKRVLVTGATGFVGRNALDPLAGRGYEIHAVSSRALQATVPGVRWHRADLFDVRAIARLMADIRATHLLHFAWYAEPGRFWGSAENFRWVEASLALLRHFREAGGRRAVIAGTCAEYDWHHGYCSEFSTPCRPRTVYGACKNALQEILCAYGDDDFSTAWGRIFWVYGPDEHPSRLVASVVTALLRGDVAACTHGTQQRDFLHVRDVASAFAALLDSEVTGPVNIASGRAVAVRELVETVAARIGAGGRVSYGAVRAPTDHPPLVVGINERLRHEVGWYPKFDLATGIAQTIESWRTRGSA